MSENNKEILNEIVKDKVKKVYQKSKLLSDPEYRKTKNKAYYEKNKQKILNYHKVLNAEVKKNRVPKIRVQKNRTINIVDKKMAKVEKLELSEEINDMIKDFFLKQN